MAIKKPPGRLADANYDTLMKGHVVHRVHLTTFDGNSFNPCKGGATRFAPITDKQGECIPSLYAGSSFESAVFETIFHDVPSTTSLKTVRRKDIEIRSHTEVLLQRTLRLVSLRAPDLKKWGIGKHNLVGTSARLYAQTARWAEVIHGSFPDADGLVWTSNQCDPDSAYLFFGDRVGSSDLKCRVTRDGATDKSLLSDVRSLGRRSNIYITV